MRLKRMAFLSGGMALFMSFAMVLPAEAATRSGACVSWACGSATSSNWRYNGSNWLVDVSASVKDTVRDGKFAYGKVRYYYSNCTFSDGSSFSANGDGTGSYGSMSGTRTQPVIAGLRVILRDQTAAGGNTAYGNWVDNPALAGDPNCPA